MPTDTGYELLDFGDGRKLERFGKYILDRPAPQAINERAGPASWSAADARFQAASAGQEGEWNAASAMAATWTVQLDRLTLELKLTPFGQVGVFPEQARVWNWITGWLDFSGRPVAGKVLNLFAYTGASTLAAALAGAEVTHVDAARTAVAWGRRNAALCGLQDAPIRWIVEDAATFVRRELRRGTRYDAVIIDPPTFGRGPKGQRWQIDAHLDELLAGCSQLLSPQPLFFVVTCHTTGWTPRHLAARVDALGLAQPFAQRRESSLLLRSRSGRALQSGVVVCGSQSETAGD